MYKKNIFFPKFYSLIDCIEALHQRKIIIYPTESVFAIGCNPNSKSAVIKLLNIKKRSKNKGFVLVASNYNQITPYILEEKIYNKKNHLILKWPGNTTFLLPAKFNVPKWLTGNSSYIAFRISNHYIVQRLCNGFGRPIISTSANITKKSPCKTIQELYFQFGCKMIISCGNLGSKKYPSKIINLITGELVRNG